MIYILTGPNKHYKEKFLTELRKKHKEFSFYSFHCDGQEEHVLEHVYELLGQISLFDSSQKCIILHEFTDADFLEALYTILPTYTNTIDIIFVLDADQQVRSNSRVFKYTDKKNVIQANPYDTSALLKLTVDRLRKGGVAHPEVLAQTLLNTVEPDPYYLENEVDKIILFSQKHEGEEIKGIRDIVAKSMNNTIWEYLKNITFGDRYKAISIATTMLDHGENEYAMFAMILWNLKLISVVKAGGDKSDAQIAKDFGYSPYSVKNARSVMKRFSFAKITLLYEKIVDLDYKIKSGVIDPRLGIILLSYIF